MSLEYLLHSHVLKTSKNNLQSHFSMRSTTLHVDDDGHGRVPRPLARRDHKSQLATTTTRPSTSPSSLRLDPRDRQLKFLRAQGSVRLPV